MFVPIAIFGVVAYVADVVIKPELVGRRAKAAARRRGKPLLNVGAGVGHVGPKSLILGPHLIGDVNTDSTGRGQPRLGRPHRVYRADVHRLPFRDKVFGAVLASHVLEHVAHPRRALQELSRVADEVFVICPQWWTPHAWLQPGHRWLVTPDGRFLPLWQQTACLP